MRYLTAILSAVLLAPPATAQTAPPAAIAAAADLTMRIRQLPATLRGEVAYEAYFAPSFIAAVPRDKFAALNDQLVAVNGKAVDIESVAPTTPYSATLRVRYERATATMVLVVDPAAPHLVTGLRLTGISSNETSVDAVMAALAALPGSTGFAVARLDAAGPVSLHAQGADRPMAIGSEFKLVILAELVRAVIAGERRWDDRVTLDGSPLPGGGYTLKPKGTPVSLRELATQMISISDNSAADILAATLGRDRIEAMLPVVGIQDPRGMRPFLTALEMFKLKGIDGGALGARYLALDEAGRRALLAGEVKAASIGSIPMTLFQDRKPLVIDKIEWFASASDMIRVMDWLRRNTERGPAAEARAILATNPGVGPASAGLWRYVGYKGGSEPGVIAMTYLLQAKDGSWYAVSSSWNDPARAVDENRFASLMGRAVELIAAKPAN